MLEKGRKLDLSSDVRAQPTGNSSAGNRFLGIQFDCCGIYARVYANREQTAYVGNCPRCAKRVEFKIGSGGTSSRFFTAY